MSIDADPGVGVRAAQRDAPEHVVHPEVAGVGELAGHLEVPSGRSGDSPMPTRRRRSRLGVSGRSSSVLVVIAAPPSPAAPRDAARDVDRQRAPRRRSTSASCSTTGRPSTSSSSSGGGEPSTRAATGSAMPACGERCRAATARGRRACRPRASRSRSSQPEHPRRRRAWPARAPSRTVSACGPPTRPGEQHRVPQLLDQRGRLVGGGAVDAEPDRDAGVAQVAGPARCRRRAGRWTTGSAPRRCRWRRAVATASSSRWTPCANQTSAPSQPRRLDVLDRRAAEALAAERRPRRAVSARWVCSRTPLSPGQRGRLAHQVAGHRERRAGRDARPAASSRATGRGAVDRAPRWRPGPRRGPRRRGPAAGRPGSAPRSIEPRVGWNRRPTARGGLDLGAEQVAAVAREDVVVVGASSCSRCGPASRAPPRRGDVDGVLVDAAPRPGRAWSATRTACCVDGQPAGQPTGRGGGGC